MEGGQGGDGVRWLGESEADWVPSQEDFPALPLRVLVLDLPGPDLEAAISVLELQMPVPLLQDLRLPLRLPI